jgi:hypothetical protein
MWGGNGTIMTINNSGATIQQNLQVNGKIGVGVSPTFPLQISAYYNTTASFVYVRTGYNGGADFGSTSYNANFSASFAYSIFVSGNIANASDRRIKKEINDINDDGALQQILAIQPKTYKYIDEMGRGSSVIYGFIAQQVREVIPLAVEIVKDYIPNIYQFGNCNSNIITLEEDVSEKLNIGDKIKIFDDNDKSDFYNINNINSNVIEIDKEINSSNVFIYGKEINDFHTLKKDYIFTLNVCATQELYKLIQQQNTIIEDLQNQINELKHNN